MRGLAFLQRTNSRRRWNLASFHSPHSLTWSWFLSFGFYRGDEPRWRFAFSRWRRRHSEPSSIVLCLPLIGRFDWQRQEPMYYRDMWRRRRDEADGLLWRHPAPSSFVAPAREFTLADLPH